MQLADPPQRKHNAVEFSRDGVRSLLACGALERLTSAELNGALERKEARTLFEDGAPRRMRNLNLFCMDLRDASIRTLAHSAPWIERLVSLEVQGNGLSSKGLSVLLDALLESATELVALSVDDNRLGVEAYERLAQLYERGVAIDVELPTPQTGAKARYSSTVEPTTAVTAAWVRLDAAFAKSGTEVPGLKPPAKTGVLAKAAHLPPSLRALYAAHDADEEAEVLGLGRIVWWPLAGVGAADLIEQDERKFAVFAAPIDDYVNEMFEPGELPAFDDDLDAVLAVATDTEEVVLLGRKGSMDIVAEHLGAAMEAVADALESGTRTIDENGRLVDLAATQPAPEEAVRAPRPSIVVEFAAALVERHVVELQDGATHKDLAVALEDAVSAANAKTRTRAVLAVFDAEVVDEVFVGDDELHAIASDFARQFG